MEKEAMRAGRVWTNDGYTVFLTSYTCFMSPTDRYGSATACAAK